MKCISCGEEIPAGEEICPFCGENLNTYKPKLRKRTIAAIAAVILCVCGAAWGLLSYFGNRPVTSLMDAAQQTTMVSYTTKKAVHTVLPENHQSLILYQNSAQDLNSYGTFSQMLSSTSAYIGYDNFARIGEEVLFLQTSLNSYDNSTMTLDADYVLYSVKDGGEPVEIDRDVQGITCASDNSVYYEKVEDQMIVQYRYSNGIVSPVTDLLEADFMVVTHCSDDDSVLGFASATFGADGSYTMHNGYISNGKIHYLDTETSEIYYVSPDGKHIYAIDIPNGNSRTIDVKYVSDQESGQLVTLATGVTELSFYEDSGSMTCIGETEVSDDVANPVGKVLHFDAESQTLSTVAEQAVALVEVVDRSYPWLNEGSMEMQVTEQSNRSLIPSQVGGDQFHYINKDGALCAADLQGTRAEVFPGFYDPETYTYAENLNYLSQKGDAFYWAYGDQVYRYRFGSLTAPEQVTLDADLLSKIESGMEIGYVLCQDGDVLEQSGNTLNLKPFGGQSSTVYDSQSDILVVGLNPAGDKVYFLADAQLVEKEIYSDKAPAVLASTIYDAVAVENGLYFLKDYSEDGGTLMYQAFDGTKADKLANNVLTLSDTAIQK